MREKTFLLGLGCQKSGTSWLSYYLRAQDNFDDGNQKEYHIWDALDIPILKRNLIANRPTEHANHRQNVQFLRWKMQQQPEFYFQYFQSLYTDQISVSADITPSYSGLNETRLRFINDGFKNLNITCKAIILIRDPVDRIKSALRFGMDKGGDNGAISAEVKNFLRALTQYYKTDHCRIRSNYHAIISQARNTFGDQNLYVGVYENMFEPAQIQSLSAFCGVPSTPELAKVRINETINSPDRDLELETEIKLFYKDVYDYCFDNYPVTWELWS
jgi:hypothetical protein